MDVSETKDAMMVKMEVPGMEPKDIQISLQEQLLTVKGEKHQEKEEKEERYYRMERSYGAFTRSVRLPVAADGSKVTATFKNGLLTVMLPKTPAAKGTTRGRARRQPGRSARRGRGGHAGAARRGAG
jgi:HSP20 family protein